ncbi:thaumatin-like protein 1b [Argentina anserina]|uniref:thaumatin-like protein 1b n=1 Tax=Argentina anserina TaxID=57926 RepID=UPI00217645E8|nr:thaumatin-like protein 1b [Potentilla anserina]
MGVNPLLMAMIFFTIVSFFSAETESASFEILNNCSYTIWPGLVSTYYDTVDTLSTTGFTLKSGESFNLSVPKSWHGRVWGRTLCNESSTTGNFSCFTADCGSGKIECDGNVGNPPATFAQFQLNINATGMDMYGVSLADGFNLPMVVVPRGGGRNCNSSGCLADVNGECLKELRLARDGSQETVACMTPCTAFNDPKFCCSPKVYLPISPETCGGNIYTEFFKQICPRANTYAFNDPSTSVQNQTTYTCASANYSIVFCPIRYLAI